jgi:Protein of unknown function (DUF4239)
MNVPLALAIVVGAAILAVLLLVVVRRNTTGPLLAEPSRATPMITMVGTAFAVLLAFVTLAAFQTYHGAKNGAQSEAVAVLEMFRTAALFPAEQRDRLRSDFVCYGRAVANEEWPAMRKGQRSPLVDKWITDYRDLFSRIELASSREQLGFQELLTEARNRTDGRRDRLAEATPSVPVPLWIVLGLGGCVAVVLQLTMADPRERLLVQGGLIAGVAAIVAAGLLLVNFLDYPYQPHTGSIEPTEMQQSLAMMSEQEPQLLPACRSDGRSVSAGPLAAPLAQSTVVTSSVA